ncbi:tetratricopeptide repeat protein [Sansalvadorimonas sp. 2012CJ34-2]|uniref:Tetratricopeptide repeat protein n=1 Tax=Parendozoicomonas callyspongiae TaxID=2942213 RepID=A0ABT0PAF7_9GAMM|nr:heme biosynthesis HemY N-terminal domain-containing protein [Sansalvadorimonas sp. 2012CJ34-2]MCL6268377.1 tetratricopeptide repeat protein [Sansalvadorimonas sp. 2012CJ34-2]
MRRTALTAIIILLLIAGSFFAARYLFEDPGYVLIAYNGYTVESSLWSLLLALVFAVVAIRLIAGSVRLLIGSAGLIYPLSAKAKQRRAQKLANKGLILFANGHWQQSQNLLAKAGDMGASPLYSYLVAARAASANNDMDACKENLRKADEVAPAAYMAIGITQAEAQMTQKQWEQALATLRSLRKKSPKHPYVHKLLKQTYEKLGDWQALADILPVLRKLKVLNGDALETLEQKIYHELFEQAWNKGRNQRDKTARVAPANVVWNSLSKAQRRNHELAYGYARCLYRLGADDDAEGFIRRNLPAIYSAPLIRLYGRLDSDDKGRQLLTAEKLLAERPNDPDLLLALGRICSRDQLWGKSREYLEASLQLRHSLDTYNELGRLMAQLDEHELSSGYFQHGQALAAEEEV